MITGAENGLVQTHPHEFPVKSQNDSSSRSLLGLGNPETHRLQPLVLIGMQGLRGKECGDLLSTSGRRRGGEEKKKKATPNTSEQQIHLETNIEKELKTLADSSVEGHHIYLENDYNTGRITANLPPTIKFVA